MGNLEDTLSAHAVLRALEATGSRVQPQDLNAKVLEAAWREYRSDGESFESWLCSHIMGLAAARDSHAEQVETWQKRSDRLDELVYRIEQSVQAAYSNLPADNPAKAMMAMALSACKD